MAGPAPVRCRSLVITTRAMSYLLDRDAIYRILEPVFAPTLHKKRVLSLSLATLGILYTDRVSLAEIGRALAGVTGKSPKHCIKQVDRLLSNNGIWLDSFIGPISAYVKWTVGERTEILLALDWTDFDADDHTTLALSIITNHGRATPLVWRTFIKSKLKDNRNDYEDELLRFATTVLPAGIKVTVLADRGFGDTKLYEFLKATLGWDYVIRFRGCVHVSAEGEPARPASEWLYGNGRVRKIEKALVTQDRQPVPAVVCVKAKDMKDAWFLATSRADLGGDEIVEFYSRRFTIEETFRDDKDDRFGLGLKEATIGDPKRRDRLLLVLAIARVVLTSLGAAGEKLGLDVKLRANTERKKRTHALITQGRLYVLGIGVFGAMVPALLGGLHALLGGLASVSQMIGAI
jgi:Transposase DDE domain